MRTQATQSSAPKTAAPAPTPGLTPAQKASYAQKLTVADLAKEKARLLTLKDEAQKEAASNPAAASRLAAIAKDRLALLRAEATARQTISSAKLSNGAPLSGFAQGVSKQSDATLAAEKKALSSQSSKDAQLKLLVVTREQQKREATAANKAQAAETARLGTVKRQYEATLTGKTASQLTIEQTAEHQKLAAAQTKLQAANAELASAKTPAEKMTAQAAVAAAEKAVRTEYAKTAVIDSDAPVTLNHQALHDYANTLKTKSLGQLQAERAKVAAEFQNLSNGALRGTREQIATDKVKLAIIDAAIAKVQKTNPVAPVDKTRNPGNVVFDGPGMFVAAADAYSPSTYAAKLKAAGVTWVALQVNNPGPVQGNLDALNQGWADAFRAQGIKVGFWGVSYGNAAVDGKTAADLTAQYKGDFYIADCEGPFQSGEGDPARNKAFVDAFQAEATSQGIGNIPRALSSMGRVALDMKPWLDNGWDAMPQAYWNDYSVYEPTRCVQFYEQSGWPKDRIHPTIATYGGSGDGTPKTISDYMPELKAGGTKGFSFYLPESYMSDADYATLQQDIANGMNG